MAVSPNPSLSPTYDAERRRLLAAHVPQAMALFVLINGVAAIMESHYFPERAPVLLRAYLVAVVVCLVTAVTVRRASRWALPAAVASTYLLVLCMGVYFAQTGSPRANCILTFALLLAGAAVFYPWGWVWQLCAGSSALLGYAVVTTGTAPAVLPLPYSYFVLGVCITLAAVGAAVLERQRLAVYRSAIALQGSETRLRDIFEQLQDIFFRNDLDGITRMVSPSVRQFGYEADDLIGRPAAALYVDPADQLRLRAALFEHGSIADVETALKRKDGTAVIVAMSTHLVRDRQGHPVGFEGMLRDVTERKQLEQQRADFLAMLTHDIKQPIMVIAGNIDMLRATVELPAKAEECVAPIARSAQALLELVDNYLDLSKIEAGAMSLSRQAVALHELLAQVCAPYKGQARQRGIHLALDNGAELPAVPGDRLALQRVLRNLLVNALKFTPDGGRVTISTRQDGATAVVAVADTGPGIPADEQPTVFDRYRQTALGRRRGGLGMGLFIVKSLVEAHGGSVHVDSVVGRGSTFVVRLPLGESPEARLAASSKQAS